MTVVRHVGGHTIGAHAYQIVTYNRNKKKKMKKENKFGIISDLLSVSISVTIDMIDYVRLVIYFNFSILLTRGKYKVRYCNLS